MLLNFQENTLLNCQQQYVEVEENGSITNENNKSKIKKSTNKTVTIELQLKYHKCFACKGYTFPQLRFMPGGKLFPFQNILHVFSCRCSKYIVL